MKHHYNKEELVELKRKYDMQVSKEALEEIKHVIDLDKEIEQLKTRYSNLLEEHRDTITRNEDYRARIDKAIELMYNKGTFNLDTEYGKVFSELLNILQGSDKE